MTYTLFMSPSDSSPRVHTRHYFPSRMQRCTSAVSSFELKMMKLYTHHFLSHVVMYFCERPSVQRTYEYVCMYVHTYVCTLGVKRTSICTYTNMYSY